MNHANKTVAPFSDITEFWYVIWLVCVSIKLTARTVGRDSDPRLTKWQKIRKQCQNVFKDFACWKDTIVYTEQTWVGCSSNYTRKTYDAGVPTNCYCCKFLAMEKYCCVNIMLEQVLYWEDTKMSFLIEKSYTNTYYPHIISFISCSSFFMHLFRAMISELWIC